MPAKKLEPMLKRKLENLKNRGALKGAEMVISGVKSAQGKNGSRCFIEGFGKKAFLRMNSNSYLGMSLRKEIVQREKKTARKYGAGPGAVRDISASC